jgi:hypothetical protein
MNKPFRWNIARREQLGRLRSVDPPTIDPYLLEAVQDCSARMLAQASNADLCFIGRSAENLFDYLSGLLATTSWQDRIALLNLSLRDLACPTEEAQYLHAVTQGRAIIAMYELTPQLLLQRSQPVAFVDLVYSGNTFGQLAKLLLDWATAEQLDTTAIRKKLRFIGITERTKTSPKTWRWQQHAEWATQFRPSQIKNVSLDRAWWSYWGDTQPKVTPSNPPWRWGSEEIATPLRDPAHLAALNLAVQLYDTGNTAEHRRSFAERLARQPAMREQWFRSLISELPQG